MDDKVHSNALLRSVSLLQVVVEEVDVVDNAFEVDVMALKEMVVVLAVTPTESMPLVLTSQM